MGNVFIKKIHPVTVSASPPAFLQHVGFISGITHLVIIFGMDMLKDIHRVVFNFVKKSDFLTKTEIIIMNEPNIMKNYPKTRHIVFRLVFLSLLKIG